MSDLVKTPGQLRCVVVGAGSLGSEFCALLATSALPLREVLLLDPDHLEEDNLPASPTFSRIVREQGSTVLGKAKTDLLRDWCARQRPGVQWQGRAVYLAEAGWQDLRTYDVLVTATDNVPSRMQAAYASQMLGLPMLDGALHGETGTGRVALYPGRAATACYGCALTASTRALSLAEAMGAAGGCATVPMSSAINGSPETGKALQATAKVMLATLCAFASGVPQRAATAHWVDARRTADFSEVIHLAVADSCCFHEAPPRLRELEDDVPLCEQMEQDEVLLINELRVAREDALAKETPAALNLPRRHLLPVASRIQRL